MWKLAFLKSSQILFLIRRARGKLCIALFPAKTYLDICNLSLPRSVTFLMCGLRITQSNFTITDATVQETIKMYVFYSAT